MLVEQLLNAARIKEPKLGSAGRTPGLAREVVEVPHEPVGEGKLETDLALAECSLREPRLDRAAKNIFCGAPLELGVGGDAQRPVDEAMREERHARFKRMRHARPVEPLA